MAWSMFLFGGNRSGKVVGKTSMNFFITAETSGPMMSVSSDFVSLTQMAKSSAFAVTRDNC